MGTYSFSACLYYIVKCTHMTDMSLNVIIAKSYLVDIII